MLVGVMMVAEASAAKKAGCQQLVAVEHPEL